MPAKILLADDSLTIQKVIKITLANEPYDILECRSEKDLYKILKRTPVDLILLDFNLSEESNGYDLAKKLKEIRPTSKVLMMFGTFDSIDENALKMSGTADKIVKPFDSSNFINLCHVLLDPSENDNIDYSKNESVELKSSKEEEAKNDLIIKFEKDEGWVVNSAGLKYDMNFKVNKSNVLESSEFDIIGKKSVAEEKNLLLKELKSWDMDVPPNLSLKKSSDERDIELPPVIANKMSNKKTFELEQPHETLLKLEDEDDPSKWQYPLEEDLVYPDSRVSYSKNAEYSRTDLIDLEGNISNGGKLSDNSSIQEKSTVNKENVFSKLIPLDELKSDECDENDISLINEETDPSYSLSSIPMIEKSSKRIELLIDDEVAVEKFWAVDEKSKIDQNEISASSNNIGLEESKKIGHENSVNNNAKDMNMKDSSHVNAIMDDLVTQFSTGITEKLQPILSDYIKEYCRETIERVAWEILPDLAENLIKKELNGIAESVKKDLN